LRPAAAALLALTAALASATAAAADPPEPPTYAQAVQAAYDIIQYASGPDTVPAVRAVTVLVSGTGLTQPEILDDLRARPPLYADARTRLSELLTALQEPISNSDPQLAQQRLREVMSMSRYDPLHRPPSLWDRFVQWVQDRIAALLRLLFGAGGGSQLAAWWIYVVSIGTLAVVAFVLFRATRGRFTQSVGMLSGGPRPPADYFTEADRLAAAGDRVGAIRALCAGVAATLEGERSWEGSPLTVREIFQRAPDYGALRPLLLPFEAAVYGGREVDEATYERAARVAAPFRRRLDEAAA
jgi:hypothetical protein